MPITTKITLDAKQYKGTLKGVASSTTQTLNSVSKAASGTKAGVAGLSNSFTDLGRQASQGLSSISPALGKAGNLISGLTHGVGGLITAIGSAIAGLFKMSSHFDSVAKAANAIEMDPQKYDAFSYAAQKAGVEFSTMQSTFTKIDFAAEEAAKGVGKYIDAFSDLSISVTQFMKLKPEEKMLAILKAAKANGGKLPNSFIESVVGKKAVPMFNQLLKDDSFMNALKEYDAEGLGIHKDTFKDSEAVQDSWTKLKQSASSLFSAFNRLSGALQALNQIIDLASKSFQGWMLIFKKLEGNKFTKFLFKSPIVSIKEAIEKNFGTEESKKIPDVKKEEKKPESPSKVNETVENALNQADVESQRRVSKIIEQRESKSSTNPIDYEDFTPTKGASPEQMRREAEEFHKNMVMGNDAAEELYKAMMEGVDRLAKQVDETKPIDEQIRKIFEEKLLKKGFGSGFIDRTMIEDLTSGVSNIKQREEAQRELDFTQNAFNNLSKGRSSHIFTDDLTAKGGWVGGGVQAEYGTPVEQLRQINDKLSTIRSNVTQINTTNGNIGSALLQ